MSESVNAQRPFTSVLKAGQSMVVASTQGTVAVTVTRGQTPVQSASVASGQSLTFGPYNLDVNFSVAAASLATVTVQDSFLQVSGNSFPTSDPTKQLVTTSAAVTVGVGVTDVILDGVGTTFALTLPAPVNDGQVLRVMAASAVSVAFSAVVTAPATVIKTVPGTVAAGVGLAWKYNESNTTWYRQN